MPGIHQAQISASAAMLILFLVSIYCNTYSHIILLPLNHLISQNFVFNLLSPLHNIILPLRTYIQVSVLPSDESLFSFWSSPSCFPFLAFFLPQYSKNFFWSWLGALWLQRSAVLFGLLWGARYAYACKDVMWCSSGIILGVVLWNGIRRARGQASRL